MAKIVAITGCPTGVAHTYMAAEALKKTAAVMGHAIRVETQGSDGAKSAGEAQLPRGDVSEGVSKVSPAGGARP
jgi:PTS system fructose-specific IIC component